jgi:hypothetical protein
MKCANCECEAAVFDKDKLGNLYLVTDEYAVKHNQGPLFGPKKEVHYYNGKIVTWFVCDSCAKKGRDKRHMEWFFAAALFGGLSYFSYHLVIPTAVLLLSGIGTSIVYLFKDEDFKSKFSRDNLLQKVIKKLMQREDFIKKYGTIKLDKRAFSKTMTRDQRKKL